MEYQDLLHLENLVLKSIVLFILHAKITNNKRKIKLSKLIKMGLKITLRMTIN